MAGAGYKLFTTGEVLTAAQVNTYLQEQTVMSFADSAARTSALSAVLAEGMMSYLRDTNAVQVYNGSAWVSVGGSSPLTTKGDLYGFSTLDARIPIGTNNQVLTADSAQSLGLKWATPSSGGFTSIATGSLSGSTTTISSIASTYRDLRLVIATPQLSNASVLMTVNGVSSVYKETDNYLSDTSMTTSSMEICSATTGQSGNIIVVEIYEYALALTKLIQAKSNATASTNRTIGTRRWFGNTSSAVSSITVSTGSGSFSGGTYTLYGVS